MRWRDELDHLLRGVAAGPRRGSVPAARRVDRPHRTGRSRAAPGPGQADRPNHRTGCALRSCVSSGHGRGLSGTRTGLSSRCRPRCGASGRRTRGMGSADAGRLCRSRCGNRVLHHPVHAGSRPAPRHSRALRSGRHLVRGPRPERGVGAGRVRRSRSNRRRLVGVRTHRSRGRARRTSAARPGRRRLRGVVGCAHRHRPRFARPHRSGDRCRRAGAGTRAGRGRIAQGSRQERCGGCQVAGGGRCQSGMRYREVDAWRDLALELWTRTSAVAPTSRVPRLLGADESGPTDGTTADEQGDR